MPSNFSGAILTFFNVISDIFINKYVCKIENIFTMAPCDLFLGHELSEPSIALTCLYPRLAMQKRFTIPSAPLLTKSRKPLTLVKKL